MLLFVFPRLLNRMLGLPIALQQRVFECFVNKFESLVQDAMATGQYDGMVAIMAVVGYIVDYMVTRGREFSERT